uniref:ATP-dependent Clp protease proteolytic subunit n=1 Tax=Lophopyxis maingayi TaxID=125041 RepID=A0A7G8QDX0_9ROSI|nr:clp protease proteolytic subunit [Lophopyxis maingayi]QNK04978.1 clp protease proteolytic subunit [Lophopyxis maingayi]
MPVGVPKIPFVFIDDDDEYYDDYYDESDSDSEYEYEDVSWIDLYNRLYHERLLFLGQKVDSQISNHLVGLMTYLSLEDPDRDLYLFINSPGGWVVPGLSIFDTIRTSISDVHTICISEASSIAALILSGGGINNRLAFPHATVMIHQPSSSFVEFETGDLVLDSNEVLNLRESIIHSYVQRTGKPFWVIASDINRDVPMSPTEAQVYGIVDFIADNKYKYHGNLDNNPDIEDNPNI